MLKIKDNVNLKCLIPYGFKCILGDYQYPIDEDEILVINHLRQIVLYIDTEYYKECSSEKTFDMVYHLIQLGFVEKFGKD